MAQVINTNVASLFASAALNRSNTALLTAQQRLSSGLRINSAKDDPTGLAQANTYDKQVRGATQAIRGVNDAMSNAQIYDGYHQQVYENLQRMREIAVAAGGTASGTEAAELAKENTRILGLAANMSSVVVNSDGGTTTITGTKATVSANGTSSVSDFDTAIGAVVTARQSYGAGMATLESALNTLQTQSVNAAAGYSRVMDTDYAVESMAAAKNQILQQAGMAALAQSNQNPGMVLSLLR